MNPTDKARKDKVRWTEDEITSLVNGVAVARLNDLESSFLVLVNKVQDPLFPSNRRRHILQTKNLPLNFMERVQTLIREKLNPAPIPQVSQIEKVQEVIPPTPLSMGELASQLFSRLEQLFIKLEAISNKELSIITRTNVSTIPATYPNIPVVTLPEPPKRERKIVFAVAGLLPAQANDLASRLKKLNLDLRCLNKNLDPPIFPDKADEVLLFAKFISHSWQTSAYNQFRRDQVHIHHGGIESAASMIEAIVYRKHNKIQNT